MASRDGDISLWLHNKLGSTDDLWSGKTICSQLSREKLLSIQDCFHSLQPYVKVKLMLSFLHLPKRNVEEVCCFEILICQVSKLERVSIVPLRHSFISWYQPWHSIGLLNLRLLSVPVALNQRM